VAVRWRNATRRRSNSVKMEAPLATCTKEGQRSVIRFLRSEGVKPIEIHRWIEVQYGDACLSLEQVYEWGRKFLNGVSSVTDSPQPGQAHRVVTPEVIAAVEAIVKENRCVTVHEIAAHLDMSHGSAHHIVHDVLQFHKVSARWVPLQLTVELKERRVDACQEILKHSEAEGDGFLGRIVTGDETWVHYHQLETKKVSKEWCHTSSPKPKKFRTEPSAGKVMLTLSLWDERGVILEHYMPRGNTISVQHMQISSRITCILQSSPNDVDFWVQVFCCNMTMLGPILPVQLSQQSKICTLSVFHIRRIRQTSPQVIFTSLDHSKRRWEASLSVPTKRYSRQCRSGCALSQKTLFF